MITATQLVDHCLEENYVISNIADEYAEPGYRKDGDRPILFGNWNNKSRWDKETNTSVVTDTRPSRLAKIIQHFGYTLEWEDEWATCSECGHAVRTSGDSYDWQKYFYNFGYGEIICGDCIKSDESPQRDMLEDLEGKSSSAMSNTFDIDLSNFDYQQYGEGFEHGLYGGQADDPKVIAKTLKSGGVTRFIFVIDSVGQFDCDFSLWIHDDEYEEACHLLRTGKTKGVDPAVVMEEGLRLAAKAGNTPGVYTGEHAAVEVRTITPEQFVRGI